MRMMKKTESWRRSSTTDVPTHHSGVQTRVVGGTRSLREFPGGFAKFQSQRKAPRSRHSTGYGHRSGSPEPDDGDDIAALHVDSSAYSSPSLGRVSPSSRYYQSFAPSNIKTHNVQQQIRSNFRAQATSNDIASKAAHKKPQTGSSWQPNSRIG